MKAHAIAAATTLGLLAGCASQGINSPAVADQVADALNVETTLDALHKAAAKADEKAYFDLYAKSAVFLGTDATERWTLEEFKAFAHPYFAKGKAWTYT